MKRATVLFTIITLIFLAAAPAPAQVQVEKPTLPDGYESWQYKLVHTCENLQETIWGRVNKEKKTLEYISLLEMNGKAISYTYAGGAETYLKSNGTWLKFNSMDNREDEKFEELEELELKRNGLNTVTYTISCQEFDKEFLDFINKLFDEARK